jgi:carbamoyltransferase
VNGRDSQHASLLGPSFSDEEIRRFLEGHGYPAVRYEDDELFPLVARLIAEENVIGWFQDRMEFGPRALGNRSILGDARSPKMQSVMNLKIKFRESFRPFAPSVLREAVSEYFDMDCDSPYMLLVAPVREERRVAMTPEQEALFGIEKLNVPRSDMPAITHVDYSARIQTVSEEDHPRYYRLLKAFQTLTGCSVIVNTSFNVRSEPIVCTPEDAYKCFMRTHIDYLVLGNYVLDKRDQPEWKETIDWRAEFELD